MRPRQCGKVWLDKDMPGSSHSVTYIIVWGARRGTEPRHRSVPQRAPAQMGILHVCSRTGQVAWNCQHQNKQWIWDLTPLLPLCSTDSRQDRTDEQKKGPNVCIPGLKPQDYYIPHHCSTTSTTTSTSRALSSCPVTKLSVV